MEQEHSSDLACRRRRRRCVVDGSGKVVWQGKRASICVGYNSAAYDPDGRTSEDAVLRTFDSRLVVQANA